jgi:hypothetical protein
MQIIAILWYCFNSLVLTGIKPETPSGGELIAFFMKAGYEVHVIFLSGDHAGATCYRQCHY